MIEILSSSFILAFVILHIKAGVREHTAQAHRAENALHSLRCHGQVMVRGALVGLLLFFLLSFLSWDRSHTACVGWPWIPSGAKDDLELLILLASTPECQNCRKNATAQFMWCCGSNPGFCGYLASTLLLDVEYYTNENDWGPQGALEPQTKVLPSVRFLMVNSTMLGFFH